MVTGMVTRGAGDNFNRSTESLSGKHHDVVNLVLYQAESLEQGTFGPVLKTCTSAKARTIKEECNIDKILSCPNMTGKKAGPMHLLGQVKMEWFHTFSYHHRSMRALDDALFLIKGLPTKMFQADFVRRESQGPRPGWTVYHALMTDNTNIKKTKIGYCPMIPASAVDFNTVYIKMKQFQHMFRALGQWTMVTYDEAIYSKAQMIKWKNSEEFLNDELEMGGFHRAMNFSGDIGHVMQDTEWI